MLQWWWAACVYPRAPTAHASILRLGYLRNACMSTPSLSAGRTPSFKYHILVQSDGWCVMIELNRKRRSAEAACSAVVVPKFMTLKSGMKTQDSLEMIMDSYPCITGASHSLRNTWSFNLLRILLKSYSHRYSHLGCTTPNLTSWRLNQRMRAISSRCR